MNAVIDTFKNTFDHRVAAKALFGAGMLACALWAATGPSAGEAATGSGALVGIGELPTEWQGQPVRPLALSSVEQRFAERFPGRIARLTDGQQIVVLRDVAVPTRMLHPAVDCYRALGYRIEGERLERAVMPPRFAAARAALPPEGAVVQGLTPVTWTQSAPVAESAAITDHVQRCFTARKGTVALRVCEQIEDAEGQRFADTSAWYWAAAMGRSTGPWRAVTVTQPLGAGPI